VLVDDGHGPDDPLHLVVEIKGYRGEDAKRQEEHPWTPTVYRGVNRDGRYGRWAFAEFVDVWDIGLDFKEKVRKLFQ